MTPLIKHKKNYTAFSKFSIYPNLVMSNSAFTIETNKLEEGLYQFILINSAGAQVQSQELVMDKKVKRFHIEVDDLAAGSYFIQLINKKSGKSYTETIVIN